MPKQVRLRRGTTAQHAAFTGADGEVTVDTEKRSLVLHDGVTAGGKTVGGDSLVLNPADPDDEQVLAGCLHINSGTTSNVELWVKSGTAQFQVVDVRQFLVIRCPVYREYRTMAWTTPLTIDFTLKQVVSVTLGGNTTFMSSGMYGGLNCMEVMVRITCDGTSRNLTWPGGWKWVGGTAPASIAAGKVALLELWSFGGTDSDIGARYSVQS